MAIKDTLTSIAANGGEIFTKARDKAHAESMRVTAFNYRRQMPEAMLENIGIQALCEDGVWYLRIFDRHIDGAELFTRDPVTKQLVPMLDPEVQRVIMMMRQDGKSEDEITAYKADVSAGEQGG
jgi:hypothetical protein